MSLVFLYSRFILLTFILVASAVYSSEESNLKKSNLIVLTVATKHTPSLERYLRSAALVNLPVKVLGQGQEWIGSGQKLKLVKAELEKIVKDNTNAVVLFTNSYTTLLIGNEAEIIDRLKNSGAKVLFSAEKHRAPSLDSNSDSDPNYSGYGQPYLNSGAYIGYAKTLLDIFINENIDNAFDDQQYFSKIFENTQLRAKYSLKLDRRSNLFQHVSHAWSRIGSCSKPPGFWQKEFFNSKLKWAQPPPSFGLLDLDSLESLPKVTNTLYHTRPVVIIGDNSPMGISTLNYVGNYVVGVEQKRKQLPINDSELPTVLMGIFVPRPIPFLQRFFERVSNIDYPKDKVHVYLYNGSNYYANHDAITEFIANYSSSYASFKLIQANEDLREWEARNQAVAEALTKEIDLYFNMDGEARLTNPQVLRRLIKYNKPVVSPLLTMPYRNANSNFWGGLNQWGNRARSKNYGNIVRDEHRGVWTVPCVSQAYLIDTAAISSGQLMIQYTKKNNAILCVTPNVTASAGEWPYFLTNQIRYGYSVTAEGFLPRRIHSELYQVRHNRYDWELSYLHPQWKEAAAPKSQIREPCRDVFWFPLVTPQFCKDIIELMEDYGQWTVGTNYNLTSEEEEHPNPDPFPTVDIDVMQVGFYDAWLEIARSYITPLRKRVFTGFVADPPHIETTIVIRYRPEEQDSNQPHHDMSTYTINLALNRPQIDYEGGGCRFLRHNCSVTDSRMGWILMHPGDLTHYHEGMSTTRGVRYILVSFLDPRVTGWL